MITFRERELEAIQKEFAVSGVTKKAYGLLKSIHKPKSSAPARRMIKADSWVGGKASEGINKMNSVALSPGSAVNSVIKDSIEAPITGTALSAVPIPGASGLIGVVGKPEKMIYKKLGVDKNLKTVSDKFIKGKAPRVIESATNNVVTSLKAMMS